MMHTKYIDALSTLPPAGVGADCHLKLLRPANFGVMAGLPPVQIFTDIRAALPQGKRKVADREIWEAITRAVKDAPSYTQRRQSGYRPPPPKPAISNGQATRQRMIESATISDEADLWENSLKRIDWEPIEDAMHFLELYHPDDLVFIGDREEGGVVGQNIRTAKDWIEYFRHGGQTAPHIICNPLSGAPAPTKSGDKQTYRGDHNVAAFKLCMAEFDDLTREEQIAFWMSPAARKLPVACLIDTGGKSIHAWLRVTGIHSLDDWDKEIKAKLYDQFLIPLGVDRACSNPARLSRLPGHLRGEKYQRILWMS